MLNRNTTTEKAVFWLPHESVSLLDERTRCRPLSVFLSHTHTHTHTHTHCLKCLSEAAVSERGPTNPCAALQQVRWFWPTVYCVGRTACWRRPTRRTSTCSTPFWGPRRPFSRPHPLGGSWTRFSKDVDTIDSVIPEILIIWMRTFWYTVNVLIVCSAPHPYVPHSHSAVNSCSIGGVQVNRNKSANSLIQHANMWLCCCYGLAALSLS